MAKQEEHRNVFRSKASIKPQGPSTVPSENISKRSNAKAGFGKVGGSVIDFTLGGSLTKPKANGNVKKRSGKTL